MTILFTAKAKTGELSRSIQSAPITQKNVHDASAVEPFPP